MDDPAVQPEAAMTARSAAALIRTARVLDVVLAAIVVVAFS